MTNHRLPWLRRRKKTDAELPLKPPIVVSAFSNGEVFFTPGPGERRVRQLILETAERGAKRHGIDRREFLASAMGMATSLWAVNVVSGCAGADGARGALGGAGGIGGWAGGSPGGSAGSVGFGVAGGGVSGRASADPGAAGGSFQVPDDPTDPEQVCATLLDASREFIFDIQTHHVNRADTSYESFLRGQAQYTSHCGPLGMSSLDCFSRNEYVRSMFLESDTTVAVLSGLPAASEAGNPLTNAEIAQSREAINLLADGSQRLVNHHMVLPNQDGRSSASVQTQLDGMQRVLETYGSIGAWKCYPAWSPVNSELLATDGWFMDDAELGVPFVEKGIELGVPLFCIHKGLPIPAFSTEHLDAADIGRIARRYPMASFIVYHSGYGNGNNYFEGPYQSGNRNGTNSLVTSLIEAGIGPNENVYAELGTTWQIVSTNPLVGGPTAAAHVLGKLLKYVGEDNVVWGTDSIWYGSPQSQIEAFLQFTISEQFQSQFGYPALTLEVKRKILGLNAARIYGVDPAAARCRVQNSELGKLKQKLDDELGKRRWAFNEPMLTRRDDYWRLLRQSGFKPG